MNNNDRLLYTAAQCLAGIFHANVTHDTYDFRSSIPQFADSRDSVPDPYKFQTTDGLYLHFESGIPGTLWTPWGEWRFATDGTFTKRQRDHLVKAVTSSLKTREFQPANPDKGYGPTYAVLAVKRLRLPVPTLRPTRQEYLSYERARSDWRRLASLYDHSR